MSDANTPSLGRRLYAGASQTFTKILSIPPLLTLPAIGIATWLATPYAIQLVKGRGLDVTPPADAGETGGTTATPRSDPIAHTPAAASGTRSPVGTAGGASLLARPITASAIPFWLPLPAPARVSASPASQPAPPRQTVQHSAPPAPRPKATARLIAPMPQQQRLTDRQSSWGGTDQRRSGGGMASGYRNNLTTGRSAAIGGGYMPRSPVSGGQQWHAGGSVPRGPFNTQASFSGGYRGTGGFIRGGGGFSGFRGGRR